MNKSIINIFSELSVDGNNIDKEFELITTAKQYDWRYGEFEYSKKELEDMANNFNNNVLGIEVAVDKNHSSDKEAYAWIKPGSMVVKESTKLEGHFSLYSKLYKFTPKGEELIKTGAYRYFSLEIRRKFEKVVGKTKKVFKNIISGLALTNAPVIKDMSPTFGEDHNNLLFNTPNMETLKIMLSALQDKKTVTNSEKEILQKMFVALNEEEQAEVKEEVEKIEETKTEEEVKEAAEKEAAEKEAAEKEAAELAEKNKNLSEVEVKFAEQAKELSELKASIKREKVETTVESLMLSETNPQGFVADKKEDLQSFIFSLSEDQTETFLSLIKDVKSVSLKAEGSSSDRKSLTTEEALDKAAQAYSEKHNVTYAEALIEVA